MMKKLLSTFALVSVISLPIGLISSCSSSDTSKINFKTQYDLFTDANLNKENVIKNLSYSVDEKSIEEIYDTPKLPPLINHKYIFKNTTKNSLDLYVQLFDEENNPIDFSSDSSTKKIMTITGFYQLSQDETKNIVSEYDKFINLNLESISSKLPSQINSFNDLPGATQLQRADNLNYDFELKANDAEGTLNISLTLLNNGFSPDLRSNYPIKISEINYHRLIENFETKEEFQKKVDEMYQSQKLNINLSTIEKYESNKRFASSISNEENLIAFLNLLEIPHALTPIPAGYSSSLSFDSFDLNGDLNIILSIYNKESGELLVPSKTSDRNSSIRDFEKGSPELLKATMEAYNKFLLFKTPKESDSLKLPSLSKFDLNKLIEDKTNPNNEFEITVDTFDQTSEEKTKTFTFRINPINEIDINFDDSKGVIITELNIEYKNENGDWFNIKPPSKLQIYSNNNFSFSKSKNNNFLEVSGFLTNELNDVYHLYQAINNKIKTLTNNSMLYDKGLISSQDFNSVNFDLRWNEMSSEDSDQLGFPYKNYEDQFAIKYIFETDPLDHSTNPAYNIIDSIDSNGHLVKTLKVTAAIFLISSNYQFDFIDLEPEMHNVYNFSFDFIIKSEK